MNRRGQQEAGFITLLELFAVVVIVLLGVVIAVRVYQVFFGPDKEALNTFELIADNMQSVLASDEPNKHLEFQFTFTLKNNGKVLNILDARDAYQGTIFGVSSDGRVTHPFPAAVMKPGQMTLNNVLPREKLPRACRKSACVCFSKDILTKDASEDEKRALLRRPVKCRQLESQQPLTLDFTQSQLSIPKEHYPLAVVKKETSGDSITLRLFLSAIN